MKTLFPNSPHPSRAKSKRPRRAPLRAFAAPLLSCLSLLAFGAAATPSRAQDATPNRAAAAGGSEKAGGAQGDTTRVRAGVVAAAERATGSITGQVIDEEGRPLPNTSLSIYSRASTTWRSRVSAAAGEDGRFRFDDLEPGVYSLNVHAPGYTFESASSTNLTNHRVGDFVALRMFKGGVITGTVTDADGAPLVAVPVRAVFLRESEGAPQRGPLSPLTFAREFPTDDRGVYRAYGLMPGVYVVSAGGPSQWSPYFNAYAADAPTYFPSATIDSASVVVVRAGEEAAGVDIRYRGGGGHAVSGTLEGAIELSPEQGGAGVMLVHASTGAMHAQVWVSGREGDRAFSFAGVADGDYELRAQRSGRGEDWNVASAPQRVAVRGADVTGIKLTLAPRAAVGGSVVLEPLPEDARARHACADGERRLLPQEVIVALNADERESAQGEQQKRPRIASRFADAAADERGEFAVRGLDAGRYRVGARALPEGWYLRSVTHGEARPAATKQAAVNPNARNTQAGPAAARLGDALVVNAGQQVKGLTVTLAEGAAQVRGRVAPASPEAEGAQQPSQPLRVHLVPAERERAEETLHYHEAPVGGDGTFTLSNLAPGRYHVVARPSPARSPSDSPARPLAWDAEARASLRREAERVGTTLELKTCQRVVDYALRLPAENR